MAAHVRGGGNRPINAPDTIVALSSGAPPAAIAVVRISGPQALAATRVLAGTLPPARQARLRILRASDDSVLDQALVLIFPGPDTATGEDLAELHLHGGRAIVEAVLGAVTADESVRLAEPGEFTRRALTNGRIDLGQAEGLADLLMAESEQHRRSAQAMAGGWLRRQVEGWGQEVAAIAASVEAQIEFAEEGDLAIRADHGIATRLSKLIETLSELLACPRVERLRDGICVVIAGPPNTGKSSLINALAQRDVAIVDASAGTTRDRIEAPVRRAGVAYLLVDTAGLRDTGDSVEAAGIDIAQQSLRTADVLLWTGDDPPPEHPVTIALYTRADLPDRASRVPKRSLAVSINDPQSLEQIWNAVQSSASGMIATGSSPALNDRQWLLIAEARDELVSAINLYDPILQAEHLRRAYRVWALLLGVAATETMLDNLFSRFCVGK